MEKALEILKKYQKNIASCREKCDEDEAILWDEINKAIAELEEAMKPKTCYGCKHLHMDWVSASYCLIGKCCSRKQNDMYEPKDNE